MYESASSSDNAAGLHAGSGDHAASADGTAAGDALERVVQRVVSVLNGPRAGLVTDVDGTISPVVARPEDAIVLPEAREALVELKGVLELVAVVSGRGVADARAMVGVDGLIYVGNHGLEVWGPKGPELVPEARPWVARITAVLKDVADAIGRLGLRGVIVEDKGATASLHYRLADDPDSARRTLLEILAQCAVTSGLRIEEGRRVINLLPPLTVTKGSAVTWLVRQHGLERLVYLGDDVTDAHAFRALEVLRQTNAIEALGVGVVGPETPPIVRELADDAVPSVNAVAELLRRVVDRLKSGATMDARAPSVGST